MGWSEMERGRRFMDDDFEKDDLERAYRRGCKHGEEKGYRMAMEEMRDEYGERGGYSGSYSGGNSSGSYGERDWDDGDFGERRGVRGTGPYSRYRRR